MSGIFNNRSTPYNEMVQGVGLMISFEPLWQTMKRKGITTYSLIKDYNFSHGTLDSLKQNRNISTATLNTICDILSCEVEDVLCYVPDEK